MFLQTVRSSSQTRLRFVPDLPTCHDSALHSAGTTAPKFNGIDVDVRLVRVALLHKEQSLAFAAFSLVCWYEIFH